MCQFERISASVRTITVVEQYIISYATRQFSQSQIIRHLRITSMAPRRAAAKASKKAPPLPRPRTRKSVANAEASVVRTPPPSSAEVSVPEGAIVNPSRPQPIIEYKHVGAYVLCSFQFTQTGTDNHTVLLLVKVKERVYVLQSQHRPSNLTMMLQS